MPKITKLKKYINRTNLTYKEAADQIDCSPEHLCRLANGMPGGRNVATKIETWSGGKVTLKNIMVP